MELNQQLHALLKQAADGRPTNGGTMPAQVLNDLTRVINAEAAKILMNVLQQRASADALPTTARAVPVQLPVIAVQVNLQATTQAASQQVPQLVLQLNLAGKLVTFELPVTPVQQQQIQQLQRQAPNQPLLLIAKSVTPAPAQATRAAPEARPAPQLNIQLVSPQTPKQVVDIKLPVSQLRQPVAQALVNSVSAKPAPTPLTSTSAALPTAAASHPPAVGSGLLLKQANQITPQQLQQTLQRLLPASPNAAAASITTPSTPVATPVSSDHAINQVLRAVISQLPRAESMQQPQQLKQWVNDWFAAKPVTTAPQQQMGGLGKMLMMLLGMALQKPTSSATPATTLTPSQQQTATQLTQALLDQILRPAPRASTEPNFTGEVRERINQLLQQLPQTQLQRLMQLFTAAVNSAQTSQARLADSGAATPEYYVLLPATAEQQSQQHELLVRREHERGSADEQGRTVWLFTLRFELKDYGPLLVKGRYHAAGTRVDFYTESDRAQLRLSEKLDKLHERFKALEVNGLNFTVQKGRVPATLAKQQSGIIRVTV